MDESGYEITSPQKWNYKIQKKITLNLCIHIHEHTHVEEHVKKKL